MKHSIFLIIIFIMGAHAPAFSQDTLHKPKSHKTAMISHKTHKATIKSRPSKKPMYRDTRLGGSAAKYNTYKKNKNGAGAVTTSPK